jgi:hypothetical protein
VQKAWDYAMAGGRVATGRIIVEGFIDFDYEITQLTVRAVGASGQVETHFCDPIGHVQVSGDYVESWQPHPMSPVAQQKAREIAQAVTANLGGQGLFGVELFVKGDMVWFSEVSPRPHDTGMVTMITQWQNEFELHARAILGLPVDTSLKSPGASAVIYGGVDAQGIVFDGVAEALQVPNRHPPVRQARELHQAPHGRGPGARRRCRGGPRPSWRPARSSRGWPERLHGSKKGRPRAAFSVQRSKGRSQPRGAQLGLVGAFPGELGLLAAEVAVGGGLGVDRAQQVQHLDDALGRRSKCSCTRAAIFSSEITPVPSV